MNPIIAKSQLNTLNSLLAEQPFGQNLREVMQLRQELERAQIVTDEEITDDIIQIGSRCTIEEMKSKHQMELTLTSPNEEDVKLKKFSVLSPLGVAIIGFKQGLEFEWLMPGGLRNFKVVSVSKAA
jgi:regulator of nucleoside diphosphate kinase